MNREGNETQGKTVLLCSRSQQKVHLNRKLPTFRNVSRLHALLLAFVQDFVSSLTRYSLICLQPENYDTFVSAVIDDKVKIIIGNKLKCD